MAVAQMVEVLPDRAPSDIIVHTPGLESAGLESASLHSLALPMDDVMFDDPMQDGATLDVSCFDFAALISNTPVFDHTLDPWVFPTDNEEVVVVAEQVPSQQSDGNPSDQTALQYYLDFVFPYQFPFLRDENAVDCRKLVREAASRSSFIFRSAVVAAQHSKAIHFETAGLLLGGHSNSDLEEGITALEQECRDRTSTMEKVTPQQCREMLFAALQLLHIQAHRSSMNPIELHSLANRALSICHSSPEGGNDRMLPILRGAVARIVVLSATFLRHDARQARRSPNLELQNTAVNELTCTPGFDVWILQVLDRITALRVRKTQDQSTGCLNMLQLVKDATELEEEINRHRCRLQQQGTKTIDGSTLAITQVYIAATILYLHVTVSDAFPQVSDIHKAVTATIDALNNIDHPSHLQQLAWPICIAGCLASKSSEAFFQRLSDNLGKNVENTYVHRALQIASRCRQMRSQSSKRTLRIDWIDACEDLECEWILL